MSNDELVLLLIKVLPYPDQISNIDTEMEKDAIKYLTKRFI